MVFVDRSLKYSKGVFATAISLTITFMVGCQNGPIAGRMYQSQMESERLLSEFRAQKKENEQLRADRTKLLQQQADTEKLAARLQSQLNSNRSLSQNSSSLNNLDRPAIDSTQSNRLSSGRRQLTSSQEADDMRSASKSDSLQWRPIRKATR